MSDTVTNLANALANTYALYLKTQNYHWHVTGPNFSELHELFEKQYIALAENVDLLAERMRILGSKAPASFSEFNQLKTLSDGNSDASANEMVKELYEDNGKVADQLKLVLESAQKEGDEGTVTLSGELIAVFEKSRWMLGASRP